ncbi:hypothetical protein I7I53_10654 [Histoplasma capsulatum var. duboisii H88]|uniref:Uncharacterized protein n=1 Tax=Ajellomyces capsulatus (strain H88) TaxID=544711 RepID=A0A8A1L925_AJEC8|nr:hypothetical protein I7I53_10654 [Histoplasma capsulatum var. duboisii H88]
MLSIPDDEMESRVQNHRLRHHHDPPGGIDQDHGHPRLLQDAEIKERHTQGLEDNPPGAESAAPEIQALPSPCLFKAAKKN